jgi:hypothetical protein
MVHIVLPSYEAMCSHFASMFRAYIIFSVTYSDLSSLISNHHRFLWRYTGLAFRTGYSTFIICNLRLNNTATMSALTTSALETVDAVEIINHLAELLKNYYPSLTFLLSATDGSLYMEFSAEACEFTDLFKPDFAELLTNDYPSLTFLWSATERLRYMFLSAETIIPVDNDFFNSIFEHLLENMKPQFQGVLSILPASFREIVPNVDILAVHVPNLDNVITNCRGYGRASGSSGPEQGYWVNTFFWKKDQEFGSDLE